MRLLTALKKGNFRLGLVSSAPRENIDLALSELDLAGAFNCIVFGREVSESKPSPEIFLLAAQKLEVTPSDCVVIEDSPLTLDNYKRIIDSSRDMFGLWLDLKKSVHLILLRLWCASRRAGTGRYLWSRDTGYMAK
jgi:hypothetical protein